MIIIRDIKKILLFIVLPISVDAADFSYSAGVLLATHDNINRLNPLNPLQVQDPIKRESSYTLRAGLSLADEAPDYSVSIDGNVRSTNYINNSCLRGYGCQLAVENQTRTIFMDIK